MEWAYGFDADRADRPGDLQRDLGNGRPAGHARRRHHRSTPPSAPTAAVAVVHRHARPRCSIGQSVTFDASASSDPSANITNYKWDFDGSGNFATDTGTTPTLTHTFTQPGTYNVILKVTDSKGQQDTTHAHDQRRQHRSRRSSRLAEPASVPARRTRSRGRLERPRRHDHRLQVGPRRQRHLRDRHRHHADRHDDLRDARARTPSACR